MNIFSGQRFPAEYLSQPVFSDLSLCSEFYDVLSDIVFGFVTRTRLLLGNLDSHFFDSLAGTTESMKAVLHLGRMGDAYSLLRRFRETSWLQIYLVLRLQPEDAFGADTDWNKSFDLNAFLALIEQALQAGIYIEEIEKWLS